MSSQDAPAAAFEPSWDEFNEFLRNGVFSTVDESPVMLLRERIQMALLLNLIYSTGCRAGDLLTGRTPKPFDHLRWRDCLSFLNRPEEGGQPVLTAEITYRKSKSTTLITERLVGVPLPSDSNRSAATDSCLLLVWLAMQDSAFVRISRLEDLRRADFSSLPPEKERVELKIRPEVFNEPVFHDFPTKANKPPWPLGWQVTTASNRLRTLRRLTNADTGNLESLSQTGRSAVKMSWETPDLANMVMPNEHERPGWVTERVCPTPLDTQSTILGQPEHVDLMRRPSFRSAMITGKEGLVLPAAAQSNDETPSSADAAPPASSSAVQHSVDELFAKGDNKVSFDRIDAVLRSLFGS